MARKASGISPELRIVLILHSILSMGDTLFVVSILPANRQAVAELLLGRLSLL